MKIDDSGKKASGLAINGTAARPAKAAQGAAKAGAAGEPAKDSVTLSSTAQALPAAGTFDAAKVEKIKAAIASGQFQVHPERIADGLIDSVKQLLSAQRGK